MADSCCCPAVRSDHRAQPRCVSPCVTGEVVPGPRAKGQGCFSEGFSQEGWERRYTEPGSREPIIALLVKLALLMIRCVQVMGIRIFSLMTRVLASPSFP